MLIANNQIVGGWPAKLLIKKFHLLEVYADNSRVRGIRATYKLNNGGVRASAHGHTTGAPLSLTIPFSGEQLQTCRHLS